jgi:hypothetical protein
MITVKVLYNGHAMKIAGARSSIRPVIHLLLESAAVCCACLVITLATFLLNNSGTYFILEVTPMIVVRTLRVSPLLRPIHSCIAGPELLGDHHPRRPRHRGARQRRLVAIADRPVLGRTLAAHEPVPRAHARERARHLRRQGSLGLSRRQPRWRWPQRLGRPRDCSRARRRAEHAQSRR